MKKSKSGAFLFFLIIICAALTAGCAVSESKTSEPAKTDAAALPLQATDAAAVPTGAPEPVSAPSATPLPSPTPSATPTAEPTPEPTATPVPEWFPKNAPEKDGVYLLSVYFGSQSVVAYRAENGQWVPERVMICSSGKTTPTGTYRVNTKYLYHKLFGAYGQYCCRIINNFLFHSVPIDEKAKKVEIGRARMKTAEYEKLGTRASDGCIRLTCADAKWIYDNCDKTTTVVMTEATGPEPPSPPALIYEEPYITAEGFGWDPTDPDPQNPYRAVYDFYPDGE